MSARVDVDDQPVPVDLLQLRGLRRAADLRGRPVSVDLHGRDLEVAQLGLLGLGHELAQGGDRLGAVAAADRLELLLALLGDEPARLLPVAVRERVRVVAEHLLDRLVVRLVGALVGAARGEARRGQRHQRDDQCTSHLSLPVGSPRGVPAPVRTGCTLVRDA